MTTRVINRPAVELRVCDNAQELALEGARHFAELATYYASATGRFSVALSGGSTPRAMFSLLAGDPFRSTLPWSSIYFFWGDERAVSPTHPDSNYRMANEALLSKVPVPGENIFPIPADLDDIELAAAQYSETIRQFFSNRTTQAGSTAEDWPRCDLVLLGMGPDGHTASLFPGTRALTVSDRVATANYVEKLGVHRITLTAATINNALNTTFLVAGADKADALKEVIDGPRNPTLYPSQLIRPVSGALLWFVDEAAAAKL